MPRKKRSPGSGGVRTGTPGTNYPNRTDMTQPVRVATGQTYGRAGEQADAQRALPLPAPAPPPAPPAQGTVTAGPLTPLNAPTPRPNEPLTAGLPVGPGPGPAALGLEGSSVIDALKGIYATYPDNDLLHMIEQLTIEGRT